MKIEPGTLCIIISHKRPDNIGRCVTALRVVRPKEWIDEVVGPYGGKVPIWLVTGSDLYRGRGVAHLAIRELSGNYAFCHSHQLLPISGFNEEENYHEAPRTKQICTLNAQTSRQLYTSN